MPTLIDWRANTTQGAKPLSCVCTWSGLRRVCHAVLRVEPAMQDIIPKLCELKVQMMQLAKPKHTICQVIFHRTVEAC